MRTLHTLIAPLAASLALVACGTGSQTAAGEPGEAEGGAAEEAAAEEPVLYTQEEVDAFYEDAISEDDFDDELQKLMEEIEADETDG